MHKKLSDYYFISAGEPSGDLLAAELVVEMKKRFPDLAARGITGPKMIAEDVQAMAHIDDLSVMGFVEVIKHLPKLKRLDDLLLEAIDRHPPKFAILVDYPGFHMRFAGALKARGIPVIQYVAPQLWAWGEKRTEKLRRVTDLVLGIMPFEVSFFQNKGVNFSYVGSPQVNRAQKAKDRGEEWRARPEGRRKAIGFFPGSRYGEVTRLLPNMVKIRDRMREQSDGQGTSALFQYFVSVAPSIKLEVFEAALDGRLDEARTALDSAGIYTLDDTTFVRGNSIDLMKTVDAALVTSGTATLECGLCHTPMAVAYVMNNLSYKIAKRLVKLPHISLVNLVAGKEIVREFVQDIDALAVAEELSALATKGAFREEKIEELRGLNKKLKGDLAVHAADNIFDFFKKKDEASE